MRKVYGKYKCCCCGVYFRKGLFKMPKKSELKSKWAEALGYSSPCNLKDSFRICIRHFKISDLRRPERMNRRKQGPQRLKPNVVPSVNLRPNDSDVLAKNLNELSDDQIHEEIDIKQEEDSAINPLMISGSQSAVKTESEIKSEPIEIPEANLNDGDRFTLRNTGLKRLWFGQKKAKDLPECYVVLEDFLKSRSALKSSGLIVNESFNIDNVFNETEIKTEVKTEPEFVQ